MISIRQNSPTQLRQLAAQRQLYSTVKCIDGIRVTISGIAATVLAVAGYCRPEYSTHAAFVGIGITTLDQVAKRSRSSYQTLAARIQEAFDCDVLEIPWNEDKAGSRPAAELVFRWAKRYDKNAAKKTPIRDWYRPAVDELDPALARVACQRANCWWDASQRRSYACWALGIGVVALASVVICAAIERVDVLTLGARIAAISPLLVAAYEQRCGHLDAIKRLEGLIARADRLLHDVRGSGRSLLIEQKSRALQDDIFEHRRTSPPIFDRVFALLRAEHEQEMAFSIDRLIEEERNKTGRESKGARG